MSGMSSLSDWSRFSLVSGVWQGVVGLVATELPTESYRKACVAAGPNQFPRDLIDWEKRVKRLNVQFPHETHASDAKGLGAFKWRTKK